MHVLEAALLANLMQSRHRALRGDSLVEPRVYWPYDGGRSLSWYELPRPGGIPVWRGLLGRAARLLANRVGNDVSQAETERTAGVRPAA
jgi:hypothetical protein